MMLGILFTHKAGKHGEQSRALIGYQSYHVDVNEQKGKDYGGTQKMNKNHQARVCRQEIIMV